MLTFRVLEAHWKEAHTLLKRVTNKHITIYDPAFGVKRYTFVEASKSFTGIALEVEKPMDFSTLKKLKKLKLYDLVKTEIFMPFVR